MNKKRYIKWQIKELLPLYIISAIILVAIFWLTISTMDFWPFYYKNPNTGIYEKLGNAPWPPLFALFVPSLILSFVLPYFAFSHQRKHIHADFYYQLPFKKNELRRTNLLISLVILLATITIIYWFGILFIGIRQIIANNTIEYLLNEHYYYNYVYFIPYYFILIIGIAFNYFISSFFVSLGTKYLDSVLYEIFGQLFFAFIVEVFLYLIFAGTKFTSDHWSLYALAYTPSISWLEVGRVTGLFCLWIAKINYVLDAGSIATRIVSSSAYLIFGAFMTWYMLFKKKDPSGEHAGKGVPTSPISYVIPHVFALFLGLVNSCTYGILAGVGVNGQTMAWMAVVQVILYLIMWGVAYYFFLVIANGTFRFKKKNWIACACVAGVVIINAIVYLIIIIA